MSSTSFEFGNEVNDCRDGNTRPCIDTTAARIKTP
jgi:hypothetical protein